MTLLTRSIRDEGTVLAGKVAIVTGASSGIGRSAASLFASEGARVIVAGRRRGELDSLVEEITTAGGEAVAIDGDVRDEDHVRGLVEVAEERFGGLDVAFNNAGATGEMGPVSEMTAASWYEILATNLTSAFLGAKYQGPAIATRGGGSIIFTSTFVGYSAGMPGMAAYAAAKAGLVGLTQVLAVELGQQRVRVDALAPGGIDTPASITNAPDSGPEVLSFVEGLHALKRLGRPEEIARAALFLASDASSFVTGSVLVADGACRSTAHDRASDANLDPGPMDESDMTTVR